MKNPPVFAKTVGRHKKAVANVELVTGFGKIQVNGQPIETFFSGYLSRIWKVQLPFSVLSTPLFDANVKVYGGGLQRQAKALQLALTRSLVKVQPDMQKFFRSHLFLTRDSRQKERRKYGLKKARKAPQFSKR